MDYRIKGEVVDKCCKCGQFKSDTLQLEDYEGEPLFICRECLEKRDRREYMILSAMPAIAAAVFILLTWLLR